MRSVAASRPAAQVMVSSEVPWKSVAPPYPFQRAIGSMKSMPAASAMRASFRHSGQVAGQRSGTRVAERPDEQLAPNTPILSALPLYIARRFGNEASRADNAISSRGHGANGEWRIANRKTPTRYSPH